MLDTETRRRIDTARDILVGKVPDPKSQVEQITIALIYKFMDDMDAEAEEFGGDRRFFAGEFAQYGWANLMRGGLSGHDVLNLYADAVTRMPENPGIPPLFRDIFNNAYLPYRDPETLRAFLKVIDEFTYDHSERLGDAFEYLLSVLGSQGDAGQFRTPRHIIDFIVAIIDPKKDETILDPACGTAGFLISSWKHIAESNTDEKGNSTLTPDEKGRLVQNFNGYDISPDMVRLSLVNMYLHGFAQPRIQEYDTLTSEDRWNEYADVILANPPFMSPKGGIRPHNRFSVQSKRSEVLFVDYMAEHLTPEGRAGIIIPEGVIFQSQNAHRQLRKMLVEDYLVAVISLPAGVFNPYSGVKTSILILDKKLAKQTDCIAFFKAENDGFDLGAQRREIEKNDLPMVREELCRYLQQSRTGKTASEPTANVAEQSSTYASEPFESSLGLVVEKERIAADGEYNLGGERYRNQRISTQAKWPMISLGMIADIESGSRQKGGAVSSGVPSIGGEQIDKKGKIRFDKMKYVSEEYFQRMKKGILKNGDVLVVKDGATTGKTGFFAHQDLQASVNEHVFILRAKEAVHPYFLYSIVRYDGFQKLLSPLIKGIIGGISLEIREIQVPVPPLEIQQEIVAEIEDHKRVIDGAKMVVDSWQPKVPYDPKWQIVELGSVCKLTRGPFGGSLKKEIFVKEGYVVYEQSHAISNDFKTFRYFVSESKFNEMKRFQVLPSDIIMSCSGTMGRTAILPDCSPPGIINQALLKLSTSDQMLSQFLKYWMDSPTFKHSINENSYGAAIRNVASVKVLKSIKVPLPPLKTQRSIVEELANEQEVVTNNQKLIVLMEKRISLILDQVWG